jgi:CHAD domain-containing protein
LKRNRFGLLLQHSSLGNNFLLYADNFLKDAGESKKVFQKIGKELAELCKEVEDTSVVNYTKELKQTVYSSQELTNRAGWHELRKYIKQLLYAYHWLQDIEKIKLLTVKEHTYFDQLQEAIGNWHDAEDLKTWLSDEQFFLHGDTKVKLQFNKCWEKLMNEISEKEKLVEKLLKKKKQGSSRISNT